MLNHPLLRLAVGMVTFAAAGQAQGQSEPSGEELAGRLARLHEAWGPRASTPNTSLTITESSRSGSVIRYRLHASGVPDSHYTLISWPVTQRGPSEALHGVTVDKSGLAICAGKPGTCGSQDTPDDPIDIPVRPVPGEPIRLGLVSEDGATKVFAKIVPVPIRGEDKACRLEATLLMPHAEAVYIEASGFPPDAEALFASDSEGERHDGKVEINASGRYTATLLPFKKGADRGTLHVRLKAGKCQPDISVPWGAR